MWARNTGWRVEAMDMEEEDMVDEQLAWMCRSVRVKSQEGVWGDSRWASAGGVRQARSR